MREITGMNSIIEIHDSTLAGIKEADGTVRVRLKPAYIHKSEGTPGSDAGTGWVQEALLVFKKATVSGTFPSLPCDLIDGELTVNGEMHQNSIPIPLQEACEVTLRLLCDDKHTIKVTGRGFALELIGEPEFVEDFGA